MVELLPAFMFLALAVLLFSGYPVAFVLGGTALVFWLAGVALGLVGLEAFYLVVLRIFGAVVDNLVLVAIPMFIFMGTMLEKSGVARDLLLALQYMTRRVPGGLAVAVTLLGVVLAATTGIIGASVVMMTLLGLPVMLEARYSPALASGTIAASGTLGILIPPSIMLIVMGDLLSISVGTLFMASLGPGLVLAGLYIAYLFIRGALTPKAAPRPAADAPPPAGRGRMALSFLPPLALIFLVLGSIFAGLATPTEAAGVGAFGALLLAAMNRRLDRATLAEVVHRSALTGGMLFGIFVCATAFSYVFRLLGGEDLILSAMAGLGGGPWGVLALIMALVFVLGFFFDWIEIVLIVLPVFAPIIKGLDFAGHVPPDLAVAWFATLVAINLQTSFLTPPFGFALFYMKGAAPAGLRTGAIYRGIVPFVALQLAGLAAVIAWPSIATALPRVLAAG
ncbi:MAG: TRAP transporter large permease [Pseudomonadota bacterium]